MTGHVTSDCATYAASSVLQQDGEFLRAVSFTRVQVWGCGGAAALACLKAGREEDQRTRDRARKVDRRAFADNAFDREYLLEKTFNSGARNVDDARPEQSSTAAWKPP